MTQVLDTLTKARSLIADPKHWTKLTSARYSQDGMPCGVNNSRATCFCALGAIARVANHDGAACAAAHQVLGGAGHIVRVNDQQGHTAVLALFDTKIQELTP